MSSRVTGWVGFDLDGTLAHYDGWKGTGKIGKPIPDMVFICKLHIEAGVYVKIFTARDKKCYKSIEAWCKEHIGYVLPITNQKDMFMLRYYDDRAVSVEPNTGRVTTHGTFLDDSNLPGSDYVGSYARQQSGNG